MLFKKSPPPHSKHSSESYSQCGEDLIISFVAQQCGIDIKTYFDIGANHPFAGNNTFRFYLSGASGLCVEPIPSLAELILKSRPRDITLQKAIGSNVGTIPFFVIEPSTLSTFDKDARDRALKTPGSSLLATQEVATTTLNALFSDYGVPDLLCIDVEGGDMDLMKTWDLVAYRPPLLCAEDLEYSHERGEKKPVGITDFLVTQDYMLFADTFINRVFIDRKYWISS